MKKTKQYISIALLLCVLFACLFSTGVVAFAETLGNEFDNTYVLDDLKGMTIDGELFKADSYIYTTEREPGILAFSEYAYCYDQSKQGNYGIYIYLYNPSGQAIVDNRNSISLATIYENGKAVDYEPFPLKLLSVSKDKYANLFYKFKIADVSKILTRVSHNSNLRRYDVGELELDYGDVNAKAYNVGNFYEYTGFAKGYGADSEAESTLDCNSDDITTLKLEVKSTYYRYNNNIKKQSNLSSVYFGVSNDVLKQYGTLQQIKANWFETKTQTIPVLYDKQIYDYLYPSIGISTETQTVDLSKVKTESGYSITHIFNLCLYEPAAPGYSGYNIIGNKYYTGNADLAKDVAYNKFRWLFYAKDGNVSSEEVLSFMREYSQKTNSKSLLGKYDSELFIKDVDYGRQYGWQGLDGKGLVIDADSKFTIEGFSSIDKLGEWFTKIRYPDLEGEDIKDISPIYIVKDSDIIGSSATVAKRLLIDEQDVPTFISQYTINQIEGKRTVLFRFALTEYNTWGEFRASTPGIFDDNPVIGYSCSQTVFLDFDIIWLKFINKGIETVIPAVSSPIDIASGLSPELKPKPIELFPNLGNIGRDLVTTIITIVLIVIIAIVAIKILSVVFSKKKKN